MRKLVLATRNQNKIKELKKILGKDYQVLSLDDIGFADEIDEAGETASENSKIKATAVREFLDKKKDNTPVIADDSGLYINYLHGEPGVHSARYAGDHNDELNRKKVLKNMEGAIDRTAYFECAICYLAQNDLKIFIGRTYGTITTEEIGKSGFGYDCLFYSSDLNKTFGEATEDEKNSVSHRGRAMSQLVKYLNDRRDVNYDIHVNLN